MAHLICFLLNSLLSPPLTQIACLSCSLSRLPLYTRCSFPSTFLVLDSLKALAQQAQCTVYVREQFELSQPCRQSHVPLLFKSFRPLLSKMMARILKRASDGQWPYGFGLLRTLHVHASIIQKSAFVFQPPPLRSMPSFGSINLCALFPVT